MTKARIKIKALKADPTAFIGREILLAGWIRTVRNQKNFTFIELNDGSTVSNFQILANETMEGYALIGDLSTGAALRVIGKIVESPGKGQSIEMQAQMIELVGASPADTFPLQKKRHSFEFLRSIAHLRPRTNTQGAVARVRSLLAYATHRFFQERGFIYLQSPIITASDCEGAGEMFQVTTLKLDNPPKRSDGSIHYEEDFFGKPTYLTVSGQLNAEAFAQALSDVYTFGPTFRAENSNTTRHLAEFWMIEPEIAFADLNTIATCAEDYIKYLIQYLFDHAEEDLQFFDRFIENGLILRLQNVLEEPFARVTYTKAIEILNQSGQNFEFPCFFGTDLQTEHERYLSEQHFKKPVIVTDYPVEIKAFYMRANDDQKTVAAMDLLVPKIGELIGGSAREERLDLLEKKVTDSGLDPETYHWYFDLRRYGSTPHAGFGLGFERLVQFATGIENIRDVNAFPRFPGHCDF
ncbi:MAG: asparagine--tRNA ligase [Simkaniaceae bacterium]|nr:asparagine--tRNA ligase [Simkaniaceae bacterium]